MASRWLTQQSSDEGKELDGEQQLGKEEIDAAEQEERQTIMRQVIVRSAGKGTKRSWMRPPIESGKQPKPPKPTPEERAAQIATAAATAAAAAAATAATTALGTQSPASSDLPSTPDGKRSSREQPSSSKKQFPSTQGNGPASTLASKVSGPTSSGPRSSGQSASSGDGNDPASTPASKVSGPRSSGQGASSGDGAGTSVADWDELAKAKVELPALLNNGDEEEDQEQLDAYMRELFGSDTEHDEGDGEAKGSVGEEGDAEEAEAAKVDSPMAAAVAEAKGKAKGKAKAKARAEAKGKAKGKAKAKAKGKAKAQGKSKAKAKAAVQGPQVRDAQPKPKAKAKAASGSAGTFAGRRPPTNPASRSKFDELKAHYMQARLETLNQEAEDQETGRPSPKEQRKVRKFSENQKKYWSSMKSRMKALAEAGVPGADRMRMAAADWRAGALE